MEKYYNDKIDKQIALDFAIRDKEGKYEAGYKVADKKSPYYNYMSNECWIEFKNGISEKHQAHYDAADGGELKEKRGRYGIYPPKMASFGSSSRFIYIYSNNINDFIFEKKLPTRVGHDANIDGYLQKGDQDYFIEAKCREIYTSHKEQEIGIVYKDVYDQIHDANQDFGYKSVKDTDKDHFICSFQYKDEPLIHFDIKQLICHFLGITAKLIEDKKANTDIIFVYLIFDPRKEKGKTNFSNDRIKKYEKKIYSDYSDTIKEIKAFGSMEWLFDTVMKYQMQKLNDKNREIKYTFKFCLVSQDDYREALGI